MLPKPIEKATTQSTNDDMRVLADHGAAHLSMVWSHEQKAGRGRHGRVWVSPPGNLYSSTLIRLEPGWPPVSNLVTLIALAVKEALSGHLTKDQRLALKWPNDVLLNGQKLTGMLLETGGFVGGTPTWVIAGIGMNLKHAPPAADALYPPTSLVDQGCAEADPAQVALDLQAAIAREIDTWTSVGFEAARRRFMTSAHRLGQTIKVGTMADKGLYSTGVFEDVDPDGALVLKLESGEIRKFHAADILH